MACWTLTYHDPRLSQKKIVWDEKTHTFEADGLAKAEQCVEQFTALGGLVMYGKHHKRTLVRLTGGLLTLPPARRPPRLKPAPSAINALTRYLCTCRLGLRFGQHLFKTGMAQKLGRPLFLALARNVGWREGTRTSPA